MSSIDINIIGINNFLERFKKAPQAIKQEVGRELKDGADRIAAGAIRDAPVDEGGLRRGISAAKDNELLYRVVSAAKYSPFIEWGTRRRVSVPGALASYAAGFKGRGEGSAEEFQKAILGWVRRKGIRFDSAGKFKSGKRKGNNKQLTFEQTAMIIWLYLSFRGIKPQPFFFKNLDKERPIITGKVAAALNRVV